MHLRSIEVIMHHGVHSPAGAGPCSLSRVAVPTLHDRTSRPRRCRNRPSSVLWQVCEAGKTAQGAPAVDYLINSMLKRACGITCCGMPDGRSSGVHRQYSAPRPQVRAKCVSQLLQLLDAGSMQVRRYLRRTRGLSGSNVLSSVPS